MVDDEVIETLRVAQRLGFFGPGSVEDAVVHALGFVDAVAELGVRDRLVDLGAGGGLPGLVLADAFRDSEIVLIDRRRKRTDFLQRAVLRLGWSHVSVRWGEVRDLASDVDAGVVPAFDVATARGFGPPEVTLRAGLSLITPSGAVVISEPPEGDRWSTTLLEELDLGAVRHGSVRVFRRRSA